MAYGRYITVVLAICVVGYVAAISFGRTAAYCALTVDYVDVAVCYKSLVKDQDAQVLLVGDSALLYGVKPSVVEAQSGRTAYNYGMVGGVFAFDPDSVIDRYLARNRAPRAVIVYLSPWDRVRPGEIEDWFWFPVALQIMQHGQVADFAKLLRARPMALFDLPQLIVRTTGLSKERNAALRADMDAARGHFDYARMVAAWPQTIGCRDLFDSGPVADTGQTRVEFARLRARYAAKGIPVYVYAAPFARCGAKVAQVQAAFQGVSDNVPTPLSDELFIDERAPGESVHVNKPGQDVVSRMLGDFIVRHHIGDAR